MRSGLWSVLCMWVLGHCPDSAFGDRLLFLDFDTAAPEARLLPGAEFPEGKEGKGLLAARGAEGALVLPATGHVDLRQGTVCFWLRPVELLLPIPRREESNLVVLDRTGRRVPGNPAKVADKIFNTFLGQPGSVRLRGETFSATGEYCGTLFEYTRLYTDRWYNFAWTWDSAAGESRQYLNARLEDFHDTEPWLPQPADGNLILGNSFVILDDVAIYDRPWSQGEIAAAARLRPAEGLTDEGVIKYGEMIDLAALRGDLIYSCTFSTSADIEGWVMEGPGEAEIRDGRLRLRSTQPPGGHFVFWNPADFPADLLIEYDFSPAAEQGLCILFFSASGSGGRDLFDPSLAPRDGRFSQYTNSDVNCYHVSYYRNRGTVTGVCNLRKDPGMSLLAVGADPIRPEPGGSYHLALWKQGSRIRLIIDGKLVIDAIDNPGIFAPAHGPGKIGLRHMAPMEAYYDNLEVRIPKQ